ncbi:hypothetical protein P280DRAFT_470122 [Massarina eburnea CBS 473.64]|uniref:Uncharacterized protein n=1 Tax=Massarina eburnea CBS 473.64 TaxID=1395130 RepID=A0A6A6RWE2_9PLEO|nr:hypothetical protein P280DRAFT_470122 [Massarina eburnea CBS 473.64]
MDAPIQPTAPAPAPATANDAPKPRYTKAEKRAHKASQKAAHPQPDLQQGKRHGQKASQRHATRSQASGAPDISVFRHLSPAALDATISQLQFLRAQKAFIAKGGNVAILGSNPLESRVTHGGEKKPKKELSAAKLEKIQQRREVRAAKKAEWAAKKAEKTLAPDGGEVQADFEAPAASVADTAPAPAPHDDEINWDE